MVSGCSDFACGLCRLVNGISPRIGIVHGSRGSVRRVTTVRPRTVILSPKPNQPTSTNVYLTIVHRFANGVPVLNIYLKRRTVYRTLNNQVACTGRLVRNGQRPVHRLSTDQLLGKLPPAFGTTHCRSLITSTTALPPSLGIATMSSSRGRRIVTMRRIATPLFNIRFRPRSIVAASKLRVVGGFLRMMGRS